MASTIQLKTGTGSAVPSSLTQGEVAINIDNGLVYYGSGSTNTTKQLESFTNITASGNISSSGNVLATDVYASSDVRAVDGFFLTDVQGGNSLGSLVSIEGSLRLTPNNGNPAGIGMFIVSSSGGGATANARIGIGTESPGEMLTVMGNISSSGNVSASFFHGDGSGLSNVTATLPAEVVSASVSHITASGNISSSGIIIVDKIRLGDTLVATQTAELHLRNQGNSNVIIESIGNNNQVISFNNGKEPDFSIGNYFNNAGLQLRSDTKTFITIGATGSLSGDPAGDTVEISGSVNVSSNISASSFITDGHITASGNISSSGNIIADFYNATTSGTGYKLSGAKIVYTQTSPFAATVFGKNTSTHTIISGSTISLGNSGDTNTHVTASGNISASGDIFGVDVYANKIRRNKDSSTTTLIKLNDENIKLFAGSNSAEALDILHQEVKVSGSLNVESPLSGHITASGNISASGNLSATGDLDIDGSSNIAGNATFVSAITASGNISASGTITADGGSGNSFTVRPNLFFFATNTGVTDQTAHGTSLGDNEGSLPETNTTTITLSQEQNSHSSIFSLSSNRVTIARAGLYKITYNAAIHIRNGSNRSEGFTGIVQETSGGTVTLVDGSEGRGYHRFVHSAGASGQTYAASCIVNVAADSIYDLRFGMVTQALAEQRLRTIPTGTSFLIEALT